MTINYQFGDVAAHDALSRARAAPSEPGHRAVVRDVPTAALPVGPLPRTNGSVTFRSSAEMHPVNSPQAMVLPKPEMRFRPAANVRLNNLLKPIWEVVEIRNQTEWRLLLS